MERQVIVQSWEPEHNDVVRIGKRYPPFETFPQAQQDHDLDLTEEESVGFNRLVALTIGSLALTAASLTWLAVDNENAAPAVLFFATFLIDCGLAVYTIKKNIEANLAFEKSLSQEAINKIRAAENLQ